MGRYLYSRARGDLAYNPSRNGEYFVIQKFIDLCGSNKIIIFDIGANKGVWSSYVKEIINNCKDLKSVFHLFEPATDSYNYLVGENLERSFIINRNAVSSDGGGVVLRIRGQYAGTNSLFDEPNDAFRAIENVEAITISSYCDLNNISKIDFIKIDTEGNDFRVILGAKSLIEQGKIEAIQFEYNHRWIYSRFFLKDVFDLISTAHYALCKIHGNYLEVFEEWHPEMDRFFETNYLIIKKSSLVLNAIGKKSSYNRFNVAQFEK